MYLKIFGIASGLSYLHHLNPSVVHGDLRGVRISLLRQTVPLLTHAL